MCQYAEWHEGSRSYGPHIPLSCQGVYFPEDEPCYHCELTGEACGDEYGDSPENCAIAEPTSYECPACGGMIIRAEKALYCEACLSRWQEAELKEEEELA